jgi:hypothetical protein
VRLHFHDRTGPLTQQANGSRYAEEPIAEIVQCGEPSFAGPFPDTWVTVHSGDIGNTFGPKGFSIGSTRMASSSKYPKSYCIELTSRTLDIAVTHTCSVEGADVTSRGEPERVRMMPVSTDYFRVLRASHPILGQILDRADERPDSHVAVIRERTWRKYLDARAEAVGRLVTLDGVPHRVVGVVPDDVTIRWSRPSMCGRRLTCRQADRTRSTTSISASSLA